MPRILTPVVTNEATDWDGCILSRQMAQFLTVGCIVRVVVVNVKASAEAIYFDITKVKDGTFWGNAHGAYRFQDTVGLPDGEQMTFRKEHINEIPLSWQPKRFQKAVMHLTARTKDRGHFITGLRGLA